MAGGEISSKSEVALKLYCRASTIAAMALGMYSRNNDVWRFASHSA